MEQTAVENTVVWFDIPVLDIDRAQTFYQRIFEVEMEAVPVPDGQMAMFPFSPGSASGALVQSTDYKPSLTGTVVYLNGGDDLAGPLSRIAAAGGSVLQEKTSIGEHGYIAFFQDTEGNRIGLHSPA
ncbi:MAG: VOC family protein [Candidatus Latescibacteria bacterium]|nr:VOC family protein [Candidatus Latescibacterota bacterium]